MPRTAAHEVSRRRAITLSPRGGAAAVLRDRPARSRRRRRGDRGGLSVRTSQP